MLLPFAQVLFAVGFAIGLRGHVAIAAACTLVTNPLTFPGIYWLAHRLGSGVLRACAPDAPGVAAKGLEQATALSWFEMAWQWVLSTGAPLMLGLAILSIAAALVGYVLVLLLWRARTS